MTPFPDGEPAQAPPAPVSLLGFVNIFLKKRWMIAGGTIIITALNLVHLKSIPPYYTASAKFFVTRTPEMAARMAGLIGTSMASLAGQNASTAQYYFELLNSRALRNRLAQMRFPRRGAPQPVTIYEYFGIAATGEEVREQELERVLGGSFDITPVKPAQAYAESNAIAVSFTDTDPVFAAAVVNGLLDELVLYDRNLRVSRSGENRKFIEGRLAESTRLLEAAVGELARFNAGNKILATPAIQAEEERLARTVRLQEATFIELNKQLELAKIEEQEKGSPINIVDRALPPLIKSGPLVRKSALTAAGLAFLGLYLLAFGREFVRRLGTPRDETGREFVRNLESIRADFRWVGRALGIGRRSGRTRPPAGRT